MVPPIHGGSHDGPRTAKALPRKKEAGRGVRTRAAPTDSVTALVEWSRDVLRVPADHPLADEPITLPAFATDWLRKSWTAHESALTMARKNGKSAICAVRVDPDSGMARGGLQRQQEHGRRTSESMQGETQMDRLITPHHRSRVVPP
ncbi:MAG: hypothetical protein OXC53_12475 [Rhodobacteraceae bacterium]|nr:hypothetical protein [Paracoccaceae bacterium]